MGRVRESTSAHTRSANFGRAPAYRGPPVPRTTEAPAVIIDSKLNDRIRKVRAALAGTAGQQRKSRVADNFDGFVRARTSNVRGWQTATDVDVLEWLCWLDSHGNGAKLVHSASCPGVGLDSDLQYHPSRHSKRRYAAASLDKGHASKLKCAMME